MIVLKPKPYSFRDRAPEWILSAGLLIWGFMIMSNPDLFKVASFYEPLLRIMPQEIWSTLSIGIAIFRLSALTINGLWRPTAHFRAIGAVGGITIWSSLLVVSILTTSARAPGISLLGMLITFEFMALWWAAGDAKLADAKRGPNGTS